MIAGLSVGRWEPTHGNHVIIADVASAVSVMLGGWLSKEDSN